MKLSKKDYKLLYNIFSMKEKTLLASLGRICRKYYPEDKVHVNEKYIYAEGEIPIAIVAHVDTVHVRQMTDLYHDVEKSTLWSPQGLGADDRAGVFAIMNILLAGYRPTVIFCDGEEIGGIGANALIGDYPKPASPLSFIIELDRQGHTDAVFYSCDNPKFEDYIASFGFTVEWGTFSDISIIAPEWEVAAVNLSIGYKNEHTYAELLNYMHMFDTIEKVKKILDAEKIEFHKYEYIPEVNDYSAWIGKYISSNSGLEEMCNGCGKMHNRSSLKSIKYEDSTFYFCDKCKDTWIYTCSACDKEYLHMRNDDYVLCDDCLKNISN